MANNIFEQLPESILPEEKIETLLQSRAVKVERIISTGQATPEGRWYNQTQTEWVILLKGQAVIMFEDKQKIELKAGDYVLIRAHQKHRVSWTSPDEVCVWLALHIKE